MEKRIVGVDLRIFAILLVASILGIIASIPYALTIQKPILESMPQPLPLPILLIIQIVFNAMLFAFLIFLGLLIAGRAGLGTPFLEAWLDKKPYHLRRMLSYSTSSGILAAIIIIVLDVFVFNPQMPPPAYAIPQPPSWQGMLVSYGAGVTEEVMFRLFLMSALVWIALLIRKGGWAYWIPIILVSLAFGAMHLPAAAYIWRLTGLVVMRTLALNGLAGIVFGWLFWKHGLESAIVAHFSADIVLHVIAPLVAG